MCVNLKAHFADRFLFVLYDMCKSLPVNRSVAMKMLWILVLLILTISTGMPSQTTATRSKQGGDVEA
jgi:hypothetical protein